MSPCPKNLPAFGAGFESGLRLINIRRDSLAHGFGRSFHQSFIARKAAGQQGRKSGHLNGLEDLPDLILDILAFEEYEIPDRLSDQKARIAGQEDPSVAVRYGNQLIIRKPVGVQNIESGNPEPSRQTAQHHISNKAGLSVAPLQ